MDVQVLGHAALLVAAGRTRILFDPWLTSRLDRFWIRDPALSDETLREATADLDAILLSHHHFDHHHYPSLGLLDRDVPVLYPASQALPRFTGSGLGHQAIPWTLRRLGFSRLSPITVPASCRIGDLTVHTLPSRVIFPEATFLVQSEDATLLLCGDSLLHPVTHEFLTSGEAPPIDVAFVPVNTLAPPGPLVRREPVDDGPAFEQQARTNFDTYVSVVDAAVTIPGSFGWRIHATGRNDFDWLNRLMFLLTPWQAYQRIRALGRTAAITGPGDRLRVRHGLEDATGPYIERPATLERICAPLTFDATTPVPPLDPETDRVDGPEAHPVDLAARLLGELVGTDYWFRQLEAGGRKVLRVHTSHGTEDIALDFRGGGRVERVSRDVQADSVVLTIAASTLRAMLDGDLLFESAFGLWAGRDNLLSAVLHQPAFYVRHVERQLSM
jgi:L-ascorbate metabolism protein UlaG (beta-lactamase superfamily)